MNKKRENTDKKIMSFILFIVFTLSAFIGGYIAGKTFAMNMANTNNKLLIFLIFLIIIYLVMILQVIIHELGHMVFGLLSGYKFCSFRIFSLILIRKDGKFIIKRYKLPSTAGQCLMDPPDLINGKMPCLLYNLGGSIFNLISAIMCLIIIVNSNNTYLKVFLFSNIIVGVMFTILNGIPIKTKEICNDGYNALNLKNDTVFTKYMWIQLKAHRYLLDGKSLSEFPCDFFLTPADENINHPLATAIVMYQLNMLLEQHRFEECKEKAYDLINNYDIINIYKVSCINDLVYLEILDGNFDKARELMNKNQIKLSKAFGYNISFARTLYLYYLLVEKDDKNVVKYKKLLDKSFKYCIYPIEAKTERKLIDVALQKSL